MTTYTALHLCEDSHWPVLYAAYGSTIYGFNVEPKEQEVGDTSAAVEEAVVNPPLRIYKASVPVGNAYQLNKVVSFMALDPMRGIIAVCAAEAVFVLEARSGSRLCSVEEAHKDTISTGALGPTDRMLFTGCEDGCLRCWRLQRRANLELEIHLCSEVAEAHETGPGGGVVQMCYHEPDRLLFTAGADLKLAVWAVEEGGASLRRLHLQESGHRIRIEALTFALKGEMLLSCGMDGTAKVWSRAPGGGAAAVLELITTVTVAEGGASLACHPDGDLFVTAGSECLANSRSGMRKDIILWSISANGQVRRVCTLDQIDTGLQPLIAVGSCTHGPGGQRECTVSVASEFMLRAWHVVPLPDNPSSVKQCIISSEDSHDEPISCLSYYPDNGTLITIDDAQTLKTWKVEITGRVRLLGKKAKAVPDRVESIAIDNTGHFFLTADRGNCVRSWHLDENGEASLLTTAEEAHPRYARIVVHLPRISETSQEMVLSGGGEPNHRSSIRTWSFDRDLDPARFGELKALDRQIAHDNGVTSILFDEASFTLLSSGLDRIIRLWKIADSGDLRPYASFPESHVGWITHMVLDKPTQRLVTAAQDGVMKVWQLDFSGSEPLLEALGQASLNREQKDLYGLQLVNYGWQGENKVAVSFGADGKLCARRLEANGELRDCWFPPVSNSGAMKLYSFPRDMYEHLWVALASGTVLGLSILDLRLPRVAATVGTDNVKITEGVISRWMPHLNLAISSAGIFVATGQLLSFGFKVVKPPELHDTVSLLQVLENMNLHALQSPSVLFILSMLAVALLLTTVATYEAVAHHYFLRRAFPMYMLEVMMEMYCYAITGAGILPLLELLLEAVLCSSGSAFNQDGRGSQCFSFAHVVLVLLPGLTAIALLLATTARLLQVDSRIPLIRVRGNLGLFAWDEDVPLERPPPRVHPLSTHSTAYSTTQLLAKIILACVTVITVRIGRATEDMPLSVFIFSCAACCSGLLLLYGSLLQPYFEPQRGAMNLPFYINPNAMQVAVASGLAWTYFVQLIVSVLQIFNDSNIGGLAWMNRLIIIPMAVGYAVWWRYGKILTQKLHANDDADTAVGKSGGSSLTTPLLQAADPSAQLPAAPSGASGEEDLEIPDEYLDPIMQDIMEDPVLLPTSGTVMDRKVIERHIMSNDDDPFNREHLSVEDLEPQPELKAEIQAYCAKHGIALDGEDGA